MRYSIYAKDACPILTVNSLGYAKAPDCTSFGPGQRNTYIIHYVISGRGWFNGHPVTAGQGFLITPGMTEEYHPDPSNPWEFLWAISRDEKMAQMFPCYDADESTNIFPYDFTGAVKSLSDILIANHNTAHSGAEMLELFLSVFKHHFDIRKAEKTPNAELYLNAAINYIQSNLSNPVTVAELTEILGISQPYLFRIFKERLSMSPKQYISRSKLSHAKKLLTETDMTVTQIGISVGFSDVLSFSKFFSAKTGLSPQHYRLKQLKTSEVGKFGL